MNNNIFKLIFVLPADSCNTEIFCKALNSEQAKKKLLLYLNQSFNVSPEDITILFCEQIKIIE